MRSRLALTLLTMLLATAGALGGQDDPVAALVDRASQYVQKYEKQFSALVCEEHQTQRVLRADGRERKRRDLVSDVLLVKAGDRTSFFRDVISVDGKAVRDRQERLRRLFLDADASRTAMRLAPSPTRARATTSAFRGASMRSWCRSRSSSHGPHRASASPARTRGSPSRSSSRRA